MSFSKLLRYLFFVLFSSGQLLYSQQYSNPLNIPTALSANFGELRNNHFHSGLDFKTQQTVNKPIFAIEDGYVSRISVSPSGYGLALYLDHPTGHTSVYGHLNSFSKKIADYVLAKQYELESFRVDLSLEPDQLPIKKGEQIALSGNTGSSGGPHLHFEIRDTETQEPLDPMNFFKNAIHDTQKPEIRGIAFYPVEGKGVVNGSSKPLRLTVGKNNQGQALAPTISIKAWGRIGVGVKAYDRMNGQANIYGVKNIRLYVDEKMIFNSTVNRFSFAKTRMLNSFIDFEDWRKQNSFFMKSFVERGNTLDFYNHENNGYIEINEERNYRLRYELEDHHGNMLQYSLMITGSKQAIEENEPCNYFMLWRLHNSFVNPDFVLNIPDGNLYESICYTHKVIKSDITHSDIYQVNDMPVPLDKGAEIWLKIKADTLQIKQQYGIVEINEKGRYSWIGGKYNNGGVEVMIRELGKKYAIEIDTIAPVIIPLNKENWVAQRKIMFKLSDNLSGISHFRGTINQKYVLFSHDTKSPNYTYTFDDSRLEKGQKQELLFTATDGAGNTSEFRYEFDY